MPALIGSQKVCHTTRMRNSLAVPNVKHRPILSKRVKNNKKKENNKISVRNTIESRKMETDSCRMCTWYGVIEAGTISQSRFGR